MCFAFPAFSMFYVFRCFGRVRRFGHLLCVFRRFGRCGRFRCFECFEWFCVVVFWSFLCNLGVWGVGCVRCFARVRRFVSGRWMCWEFGAFPAWCYGVLCVSRILDVVRVFNVFAFRHLRCFGRCVGCCGSFERG